MLHSGLGPRLTGSLAYILPLTEAFKFMFPLIQQFPPLGVIFGPITLATLALNTIPFIPLILFVTYIVFAQIKDVPRLVRFNLEQERSSKSLKELCCLKRLCCSTCSWHCPASSCRAWSSPGTFRTSLKRFDPKFSLVLFK